MIDSTSSSHRLPHLEPVFTSRQSAMRSPVRPGDRIATNSMTFLRSELLREPEIRPEVLERARALAANPDYPPPAVTFALAKMLLDAPDQSEDGT